MSSADDEFEALFDEVAAQRKSTVEPTDSGGAPSTEADGGEDSGSDAAGDHDTDANPMFGRLGNIVRLLHDSLRELGYDQSLSSVADQITDAQDRLEYVANLTEQAANKTLNAIDVALPELESISKQADDINQRWDMVFAGKLSLEDFKALASNSREFATAVKTASEAEKARLLDIMMAQDFQDITGQLIKKIVTITHQAELELAKLLRDNAPPSVQKVLAAAEVKEPELMQGPSVPSAAMGQDDVDSLLADLGF